MTAEPITVALAFFWGMVIGYVIKGIITILRKK